MSKWPVSYNLKLLLKLAISSLLIGILYSLILVAVYSTPAYGYVNPHDAYSSTSEMCQNCHKVHGPPEGIILLRESSIKKLCYTCHGTAGGSNYNVQTGDGAAGYNLSDFGEAIFGSPTKTSYHPVNPLTAWTPKATGDQALICTNCHNAHKNPATLKRLLQAGPNQIASGNAYCWVCHGSSSSPNANPPQFGYNMGGDHETNYSAGAHSVYVTWTPASGSNIQCENCHTYHGSNAKFLYDYRLGETYPNEEQICYQCHSSTAANSWNNRYIQSQFGYSSRHNVGYTLGNQVECENCHNAHFVKRVDTTTYWQPDRASNPNNTRLLMSSLDSNTQTWVTTFCIVCHNGTPPTKGFTSTSVVPYTVTFPDMTGYGFFPGWNKQTVYTEGGIGYGFTGAGHYTLDASTSKRAGCDNCHDPHASQNPRLTAFSGATTQTATPANHTGVFNIFRNNSNTYLEEGLCFACHKGANTGGSSCTTSGCHTTNMKNIALAGYDGVGNLYVAVGTSTSFYKWSPSAPTTWTSLPAATGNFAAGAALVWADANYIYAQKGGATTTYQVFKIAENAWATESGIIMAAVTGTRGSGGSMVHNDAGHFFSTAGGATTTLSRYSLTGNRWNTAWAGNNNAAAPAVAPLAITTGGALVYARNPAYTDGAFPTDANEFLYAFQGGTVTFWKYQIKTNAWNPAAAGGDPADLPTGNATGDGASFAWTRDDYIYALRGGNTTGFWRYSISGNSWTQMPSVAVGGTNYAIGSGGSLTWDGDKYLYALRGGATNTFLRYNTITQQWETLANLPANVTTGGAAVFLRKTVHPYSNYSGRHSDTESGGSASFGTANRHAECIDCHDPHAAKPGTNATKPAGYGYGSAFGYTISNVLLGSYGVTPTYSGVGPPISFAVNRLTNTLTDFQYELCFKCHSNYSGYPGGQTNTASEFNPANASQHGVVSARSPANTYINANTLEAPFAATYTAGKRATLACDDCHLDSATTDPRGPHGSAKAYMLRANPDMDLCLVCHKASVYRVSTTNTLSNYDHSQRAWTTAFTNPSSHMRGRYCRNCHAGRIGDIHGTNTRGRFLTGAHITATTATSCTTDGNCNNHTETF